MLENVLRGVVDCLTCLEAFDRLDSYNEAVHNHIDKDTYHQDQSSHFVLRAISSEGDDYFAWFLSNEVKLFNHKLASKDVPSLSAFCKRHSIEFDVIPDADIDCFRAELLHCQDSQDDLQTHFKVPFTQVLELVSKRSVFLHGGYAFVPVSAIASLLRQKF